MVSSDLIFKLKDLYLQKMKTYQVETMLPHHGVMLNLETSMVQVLTLVLLQLVLQMTILLQQHQVN